MEKLYTGMFYGMVSALFQIENGKIVGVDLASVQNLEFVADERHGETEVCYYRRYEGLPYTMGAQHVDVNTLP